VFSIRRTCGAGAGVGGDGMFPGTDNYNERLHQSRQDLRHSVPCVLCYSSL